MTRSESTIPCLDIILGAGPRPASVEERYGLLCTVRQHSQEWGKEADCLLLDRVTTQHRALAEAEETQKKMRAVFEKLTAPPLFEAVFHGLVTTPRGPEARITCAGVRATVGLAEDLDPATLVPGEVVYVASEKNVILLRSGRRVPEWGEMAAFQRWVSEGWMEVRSRDEETRIVEAAAGLREADLRPGDQVRWTREDGMALEKMPRSKQSSFFLEDMPKETFADIGGLGRQIDAMQRYIRLRLHHADIVRRYHLRPKRSVTLSGPPGGGKTMLGRGLANWLGSQSPSGRCQFMYIKPSAMHSMWYSQSEANYREVFRVAREAGEADPDRPVVMFFDEADSIGSRGGSHMQVDSRVLTAFAAELDGLEDRGNILVVAATNRPDALDPCLMRPGRLGDLILEVPPPNREAAHDIFLKYLHADMPYGAADGRTAEPEEARQTLIEAAVSRIFSPNGDGTLATLVLRDGKHRPVLARDLVSGAVIAKIVSSASERACEREVQAGRPGLVLEDLLSAMAEQFQAQVSLLTPANCRLYLTDLPQDIDVVAVEPAARKVREPHRYLHLQAVPA